MIRLTCRNCERDFYNYPSNNRKLCSNKCRHEYRSKMIRGENHPLYRHGLSKTPFHTKWWSMIQRCNDANHHKYNRYGGRGIGVCERWKKFENFYADMHESFCLHRETNGLKNTTIERVNVDGDYSPSNCRWVTPREQSYNKTNSIQITHKGETKCLKQWARQYPQSYSWFYKQIRTLKRNPEDVFEDVENS